MNYCTETSLGMPKLGKCLWIISTYLTIVENSANVLLKIDADITTGP